ncbi:MAG: flagellar biosynthesis protein FlgL [Sulfuricurvum sp.]|nr:flagellar biosynthesis protein FlgL [Sulfuricurvum sp.]
MRVNSGSYFNNIYGENNKLNKQLFDVNKQIASGQKIQYAHENPSVFVDTLRLDDELTTLEQVKKSAQNAYKSSTQTDTTIGEIVKTIESMKVKMLNAANSTQSDASIQAIAKELRGLQSHLFTLANTSIGGQYLFSGTATSIKPIDSNGVYQGNDQDLKAFLGSGVKQKYNISGSQLFLGSENTITRTVSTNISQKSLTDLYPDIMQDSTISRNLAKESYISGTSTIRDLMGDIDTDKTNDPVSYFYVQGTRSDGSSFKSKISMNSNDTMDTLMHNIALQFDPNQTTPSANQVNVTLNAHGQIEISDKKSGSSKLDFHMVGAVDFSGGTASDTTTIDDLHNGTTDFQDVIDNAYPPSVPNPNANGLYIKEFTKSGFQPSDPLNTLVNVVEGASYDRTLFTQNGSRLISNISQIVKGNNEFASSSTKIADTADLNTTVLRLEGMQIDGTTSYSVDIDLSADPVTVNGAPLQDGFGNDTAAADMTYQQLTDVINMAITGQVTIEDSYNLGKTSLTYDGKIVFEDLSNPSTKATLALYDAASDTYPPSGISSGAALVFNANSALTIRDPKTDFFKQIEEVIQSVEQGKMRSDGSDIKDPRNGGIQNGIQMLDDLGEHVNRLQTEAGSYSQTLQASADRTDMLIISTKTLQSDVIDTDIAEATLRMQQLSLNYQALLSNISKVSKLSLVNYL